MEPLLGSIILFAGNFAPRGWALCNGQLMSIAANSALFSILGTTYGGDGKTTFALPDLRSRVPLQQGQGPGLTPYALGEATGSETVTLTTNQIPSHSHALNGTATAPSTNEPLATALGGADIYSKSAPADAMAPTSIGNTGGNQPHNNIQPVLALNFIIATEGIFPSHN